MDATFAELVLATLQGEEDHHEALVKHPALAALVRHQQMVGNAGANPETILEQILADPGDVESGAQNLAYWGEREAALWKQALAATTYLPEGTGIGGDLYLIVGYDIGVAAPPDMALNVAHGIFVGEPEELGFYATHEAHHVGFLAHRAFPDLQNLGDPDVLRAVIRFSTQLEGMAVHAAHAPREAAGALGGDADYGVYTDEATADQVIARYREVLGLLDGLEQVSGATIGQVLGAMSSGERLWYQFGALVSWEIERGSGREALIATITDPAAFDEAAARLLAK